LEFIVEIERVLESYIGIRMGYIPTLYLKENGGVKNGE
jgi:hypothetical protein